MVSALPWLFRYTNNEEQPLFGEVEVLQLPLSVLGLEHHRGRDVGAREGPLDGADRVAPDPVDHGLELPVHVESPRDSKVGLAVRASRPADRDLGDAGLDAGEPPGPRNLLVYRDGVTT